MKRISNATGDRNKSDFKFSVKELQDIMELRGQEAINHIQVKYNGIGGLCAGLKTSPSEGSFFIYKLYCLPITKRKI